MKKRILLLISLMIVGQMSWGALNNDNHQAKLNLPWTELQRLLQLDSDQVRLHWDEFQALLKQTTTKARPTFAFSDGDVLLSKAEFKRLIDTLVPPPPPIESSLITKSAFTATVKKESVVVTAVLDVHIENDDKKIKRIVLFPSSVGFDEVLLDDQPALVENDGNRLWLTTRSNGHHVVRIQYAVKNPKATDSQQTFFPIIRTPLTTLQLTIPQRNIDVHVENAVTMQTGDVGDTTVVKAVLSPRDTVFVTWNPVVPEKEKGPAKVHADVNHLLTVEDDALRVRSLINLNVLHNTINAISVSLPAGYDVIEVEGEAVGDWKTSKEDDRRMIIPLTYARKGFFQIRMTLEKNFESNKVAALFSGFHVEGTEREKGYIGIELRTSAEIASSDEKNIERVDIQELPPEIVSLSSRPLLYGYQYVRPGFSMTLNILRHSVMDVLTSVIDSARGVSWLTKDGKTVHQVSYRLKNSWKQFLEVALPKEAQVWSVFVDGRPAKPSQADGGKLLIPLERSRTLSGSLAPYDVEVIYFEEESRLPFLGKTTIQFPVVDMMINQLNWAVYMPKGLATHYFGTDLKTGQEEYMEQTGPYGGDDLSLNQIGVGAKKPNAPCSMAQSQRPASKGKGFLLDDERMDRKVMAQKQMVDIDKMNSIDRVNEEQSQTSSAPQIPIEPMQQQVITTREVRRVAGVLPIRVDVPVNGHVTRYSKDLLVKGEAITLPIYLVSVNFLRMLILAVLVMIGVFLHKVRERLFVFGTRLREMAQPHMTRFAPLSTPFNLVIVTAVLNLVIAFILPPLVYLTVIGFLFALGRWILGLLRVPQGGKL